jgi:hypothetical protein
MSTPKWHSNPPLTAFAQWGPRLFAPHVVVFLCSLGHCLGQGTMTVTFEGQPPGTYSIISEYSESGMLFFVPAPYTLRHVGSGLSGNPENGTAYLETSLNTTITVDFPSGLGFSLSSLDAAALPLAGALHLVGFRRDGTTVTNDFIPAQRLTFQTFGFSSGFVNLDRIEMNGGYALDNLVVGIPEPPAGMLMLLGTLTALHWVRPTMKRQPLRQSVL